MQEQCDISDQISRGILLTVALLFSKWESMG